MSDNTTATTTTGTWIPSRNRPIFEGLTTDEEKFKVAMAEYDTLKNAGDDGLDFTNKTAMWIAFERDLESQREDHLFDDFLAKHFMEPYGQRLSDAMSFGLAFSCFDPPGENVGLGLEGHVMYTAARTKLISDRIDSWLHSICSSKDSQVVNLGAGVDTRAYWMESLKKTKIYWEVDTDSVMDFKRTRMDQLKESKELPEPFCECKSICMDFSKDSILDHLTSRHGFQVTIPTCWILEGLIMYLKRDDTEQLLDDISDLSAPSSCLILNFSVPKPGQDGAIAMEEIDKRLQRKGWNKKDQLMFGEEGFNFGRYPSGASANKQLGFAIFEKVDRME